jgi:hypothetical protein
MTAPVRAIILSQGEGNRWKKGRGNGRRGPKLPHEKQLVPMGKYGAANIVRTYFMLRNHGCPDIVLVARPDANGGLHGITLPAKEPTGELLQGVLTSMTMWAEKTMILLGDVAFSHAMIDHMLLNNGLNFYGRAGANRFTGKEAGELFGLVFHTEHRIEIMNHCHWMTARGRPINYPPKLWALYRLMAGFEHDAEGQVEDKLLVQLDDYTDDLDSPEGYKQFWSKLNGEAAIDDDTCFCDDKYQDMIRHMESTQND